MERPHRAYELRIFISADTRKDISAGLEDVVEFIEQKHKNDNEINSATGSGGFGHCILMKHDPDMTFDQYFIDIEKWNAEKELEKKLEKETNDTDQRNRTQRTPCG